MKFTKDQLDDWTRYEDVRSEGRYNMYDPNARILTGLSKDEYSFVMNNYTELKEEVEKNDK